MQLSENKLLEIRKEADGLYGTGETLMQFKVFYEKQGYIAGAAAEALKILPIYEAAKELIHLHACEQEGLSSGRPSPEQWMEAVEELTSAILAYDKNENFIPKYILVEQERDELITQRKNLQDYYIKIIDRQTKEWIEISEERDRYREALEKISGWTVAHDFNPAAIAHQAISTHSTDKNVSQKNKEV